MFRKLILILLALLLAIAPACAEDASILPEALLHVKTANALLGTRYGLTTPMLGLFTTTVDVCGEAAVVTLRGAAIPEALTGTYYVIIAPENVQALWTHDGADEAVRTSTELSSPVWGAAQLAEYLSTDASQRHARFTPYFPEQIPDDLDAFLAAGGLYTDVNQDNRDAAYAARDKARLAVQALYDLTDEEAAALHIWTDSMRHVRYPDGHGEWQVIIATDVRPEEVNYFVTLAEDSLDVLTVEISSGGVG
ncbi:MAG: hypothetical protein IJ343_00440 [Clostridia bacterium]|nr:hypothetical protein [Clostridia bacterium]